MASPKKKPVSKAKSTDNGSVSFRCEPEWVDIDAVIPNEYNPNAMNPDQYAAFCKHVDDVGFTSPVAVAPINKRGKYVIIDGWHRWKYLSERGAEKCPVVIMPGNLNGTNVESQIASLRFNIHGVNDTIRLGAIYQAALGDGYKADTLAAILGEAQDDVQKIVDMLDYSPPPPGDDHSSGTGGGSGSGGDEDTFVDITFALPTEAWENVVKPQIERVIKLAKIKKNEDEPIMFGQALELMAGLTSSTSDDELQ